jgi:enoyl-CoA hydratase
MKLVVNQAYSNMGLHSTQLLGSVLDGMLRNTPEALDFIKLTEQEGARAAVARRDAPFGDYSQGERPDPNNVIDPSAPRRRRS